MSEGVMTREEDSVKLSILALLASWVSETL